MSLYKPKIEINQKNKKNKNRIKFYTAFRLRCCSYFSTFVHLLSDDSSAAKPCRKTCLGLLFFE